MQKKRRLKPSIVIYIYKIMIVIIMTLIVLILMKANSNFKSNFYKYVYDKSFKFNDVVNFYHKYFDSVSKKIDTNKNTELVSSGKINYSMIEKYLDGAKLSVGSSYAVPVLESGIVVYMGEKENYGNTIIVQQINGIDVWYGNITDSNIKLYDYVTKGSVLGNCNDYLYLVFKKNGKVLSYEENL